MADIHTNACAVPVRAALWADAAKRVFALLRVFIYGVAVIDIGTYAVSREAHPVVGLVCVAAVPMLLLRMIRLLRAP